MEAEDSTRIDEEITALLELLINSFSHRSGIQASIYAYPVLTYCLLYQIQPEIIRPMTVFVFPILMPDRK